MSDVVVRLGKTARQLKKSKQPKAASRSMEGMPHKSEGVEGEIQARMTDEGAMLYAKIGNKWYTTSMVDAMKTVNEVRTTYISGTLAAGTSGAIGLPAEISSNRIIGVTLFLNHSGNFWHIYNWADISDDHASSAETGAYVTRHRVLYNSGSHTINVDRRGSQIAGNKGYRAIIFYI
jgi:hypothetical protein